MQTLFSFCSIQILTYIPLKLAQCHTAVIIQIYNKAYTRRIRYGLTGLNFANYLNHRKP